MDALCQNEGCRRQASFHCPSCSSRNFFCSSHSHDHSRRLQNHFPVEYIHNTDDSVKHDISESISRIKNNTFLLRLQVQSTFRQALEQLYSEYSRTLKLIQNIEENSSVFIRNLSSYTNTRILTSDYNTIINAKLELANFEEIKAVIVSATNRIYEDTKKTAISFFEQIYPSPLFRQDLAKLDSTDYSLTANPDLVYTYSTEEESKLEQLDFPDPDIFYPNDKGLRIVNLADSTTSLFNFPHQVSPMQGSSACLIENRSWFYSYAADAYILDFANRVSTRLNQLSRTYYERGCAYKDGSIYLFGGVGGKDGTIPVKECFRTNKGPNDWSCLAHLPEVMEGTFAAVVNNKIYVVGYASSKIMQYDPGNNQYTAIELGAGEKRSKVICDKYVVVKGEKRVWEIGDDGLKEIPVGKNLEGDSLAVSCTFRCGKYIYFMLWGGKFIRFSLIDFTTERVRLG
jgi:hypothetical protein